MSKVKDLLSLFPNSSFNIAFSGLSFTALWRLLSDRQELERMANSFSIQSLTRDLAKVIIEVLRQENIEFGLVLTNLNHSQALHAISKADLTQEAIQIMKVRSLAELFMKNQMPHAELAEFAAKGIEYLLEISEKRFIPWFSICTVAVLGTLQIIIGGVLIATGFGASVGMSFIAEGMSDMLYAFRAYSSRQFDWTDYAKQKAVSLIISACSLGLGKLKDAAKGTSNLISGEAATLAQEATREVLEGATTQLATNAKTVGKEMLITGKNLKSLAIKFTGVKAAEAVAREGMNVGMQYLTSMSLDAIKPYICGNIQEKVLVRFSYPELKCLLRKMYALDTFAR